MNYKDLVAWQHAMTLCEQIYRVTDAFPGREIYGLTHQVRKSAVSIPSNIAEGEGRLTSGERRQFLSQARGSLFELETQLIIAERVGYLRRKEPFETLDESRRALEGYIGYVRRR
ncbi:MAG TPA: four helix bundle protein [Thermoanaerobaculia bacterium]|nr:four helix bundle protein [Thermoanaerobaculia bacterium]